MHENKEATEYVILVAAETGTQETAGTEASLEELSELVKTAGAVVVGTLVQRLPAAHPGTYLGSGKLSELKELLAETEATGIVTDDELSPVQMHRLEEILSTKVMDRTMVILDIFAAHARTAEGKLQVELAQLRYSLSMLTGKGTAMSRLGGGIGTRGPGEKKLEQDRRVIRNRIAQLKRELSEVRCHRELTRKNRDRGANPVFAIVGYTNVGKSTLLNRLTGADTLAEDKLFATLDTTTRAFYYAGNPAEGDTGSGRKRALLIDTVGFIRRLPHHLVDAFRSTLEEAGYADYILHVADAASPDRAEEMRVVYETLDALGIGNKKVITLFNKIDKLENPEDRSGLSDPRAVATLYISAKEGTGLSRIGAAMDAVLREDRKYAEVMLGFQDMALLSSIRQSAEILAEEYTEAGIRLKAYLPAALYGMLFPEQPAERET